MIAAILALLLQAGQPASASAADDIGDRICTASAKGTRQARVDVSVEPDPDGEASLLNVGWSPPRSARPATSRPDIEAPRLMLYYAYAEADNIDEISDALGDASSIAAPDGTWDDMALAVRIDGGETWYVALDTLELDTDQRFGAPRTVTPPRDARAAWLSDGNTDIDVYETLETARTLTLSVVNRAGHPVSQAGYDLSATAERDRLFRTAWKKAHAMARKPLQCPKVDDE